MLMSNNLLHSDFELFKTIVFSFRIWISLKSLRKNLCCCCCCNIWGSYRAFSYGKGPHEFSFFQKQYRIIAYPNLEETHNDHWVQPLASQRTTQNNQIIGLRAFSRCLLNSGKLNAIILPWGAFSSARSHSCWRTFSWQSIYLSLM